MDLKTSKIDVQIFQHYSKINYAKYFNVSRKTFSIGRGKRKKEYIPLAVSFDIETTSTVIDGHNVAWCYHWQIGIDDDCFYKPSKSSLKVYDYIDFDNVNDAYDVELYPGTSDTFYYAILVDKDISYPMIRVNEDYYYDSKLDKGFRVTQTKSKLRYYTAEYFNQWIEILNVPKEMEDLVKHLVYRK